MLDNVPMICADVASTTGSRFRQFYFWPHRRILNKLLSRLPLLILWTFVVTVVLYKFLLTPESVAVNEKISLETGVRSSALLAASESFRDAPSEDNNQLLFREPSSGYSINDAIKTEDTTSGTPLPITRFSTANRVHSTTKKPEVYSRQGKVFILIVQDEKSRLGPHYSRPPQASSNFYSTTANKHNSESYKLKLSAHIRILIDILESHRIGYTIDTTRNGLPAALLNDRSDANNSEKKQQYSVIVIDDYSKYDKLNHWIRDQLDRHCRANNIGVITYIIPTQSLDSLNEYQDSSSGQLLNELNYNFIEQPQNCTNPISSCLTDYQLNDRSPVWRILKKRPNFILHGPLVANINQSPWVSMSSNHITYEPLTWAQLRQERSEENVRDNIQVLSMFDRGLYDGIKRVIFGGANHFWLNRVLFLDAIEHLSLGKLLSPLDRFIQIDIDDVFVAESGKRMNASDVEALIQTQRRLAQLIAGGFKFNLGFSGKYFKHGSEPENLGDEQLVKQANEFTWFCHTWSHSKAHLANDSMSIRAELRRNFHFAREHKLPMIGYSNLSQLNDDQAVKPPTYAVAPHHSGVYPIHEQLYEAWQSELNVQVTSTEEYPRLRPASGRRAFVYKSIKVLPRQTCGLYTHTIFKSRYPGGMGKLDASIMGGELFETILHNPVNIYMTHMSNYANDRLAPYTFLALLDFVRANTNLQLRYAPSAQFKYQLSTDADTQPQSSSETGESALDKPTQLGPNFLAQRYFNLFPSETQPLWTNPCDDKRHLAIWARAKLSYCRSVPKLLIVGPQKTGTTALYTYLKLNPLFKSSQMSSTDFEEVQFFNDKNYPKGVDWYFQRFASNDFHTNDSDASLIPSSLDSSEKDDDPQTLTQTDGVQDDRFYYFDKSATYFDDPKAPQRASHLLPSAKILIMLIDPADRAYSWYQHVKAHGDPIASAYSFEQVIMGLGAKMKTSSIQSLRNRCLQPGFYSEHLTRWLDYYPSRQVFIIDGQWFRYQPASVMNKLQLLLRVPEPLNYSKLLVYSRHKGFYCSRTNPTESIKCLGSGKGRRYPPMSERARVYLNKLYWPHNKQLVRLLSEIGQPLPIWLEQATSSSSSRRAFSQLVIPFVSPTHNN